MCVSCVGTVEFVAANVGLAAMGARPWLKERLAGRRFAPRSVTDEEVRSFVAGLGVDPADVPGLAPARAPDRTTTS